MNTTTLNHLLRLATLAAGALIGLAAQAAVGRSAGKPL